MVSSISKDRLPKLKAGRQVRPAWALGGCARGLTASPPGDSMVLPLTGGWLHLVKAEMQGDDSTLAGRSAVFDDPDSLALWEFSAERAKRPRASGSALELALPTLCAYLSKPAWPDSS